MNNAVSFAGNARLFISRDGKFACRVVAQPGKPTAIIGSFFCPKVQKSFCGLALISKIILNLL